MSTPTPFAEAFDAIDPARANRAAIDHANTPQEPSFYLLDDDGGRFVVDRTLGVVSLRDASILDVERGSVRTVKLCVIEPSGARYDLEMKLRLTGPVPAMVGAEDIDFLAGAPSIDPPAQTTPPPRAAPWSAYAAATAHASAAAINETARFGAAIDRPAAPAAPGPYRLHLFTPLPPHAEKTALWSL